MILTPSSAENVPCHSSCSFFYLSAISVVLLSYVPICSGP